jgi:hypothetical protein
LRSTRSVGGAEQQFAHEMRTPRAHHQQIGLPRLGELDQRGGCRAL